MHADTSTESTQRRVCQVTLLLRVTRNLVVTPGETPWQVGLRKAQVLDWRWTSTAPQVLECRQIALPAVSPGDPHYDIEYDESIWGGLYSNTPAHAYIPVALIEAVGLEAAFELQTGLDPVHIINSDSYDGELVFADGSPWEEAERGGQP
jgi:hypothetical protein